jgi:hypothetical protein
MPANTVYVGRPSKWGNPYTIKSAIEDTKILGKMKQDVALQLCLNEYEEWLRQKLTEYPHFLDELKGKDLACWCPLDKLCHADVILKVLKEAKL